MKTSVLLKLLPRMKGGVFVEWEGAHIAEGVEGDVEEEGESYVENEEEVSPSSLFELGTDYHKSVVVVDWVAR